MKSGNFFKGLESMLLFGCLSAAAFGATWFPLGPYGGDARSFAADPSDSHHLYLGTATGWLYESHDTGANWIRVARLGKRDDLVLDHIFVDAKNPKRLLVGAWKVDRPEGGVYISQDGGQNWYEQAQMRGQSVRAMARSASDPQEIAAGTLEGVYLSHDNGVHWRLISPEGSKEIHEVESLAIDPIDPKIIYAGTWHLPWKTTDGGETWTNIKQGIIDDSDVFSIIVDPTNPKIVYASACSGIYKSVNGAEEFKKIQGISYTARRTRKLLQDPQDLNTVYAGTTEGLYKTRDAGRTFARVTGPNVVVNDVYVDPTNPAHVLLATDHGGVLSSEDDAANFQTSNTGFSSRLVSSFASDPHNPALLYVGVVNDRETGGVFSSQDGGVRWEQHSDGLGGRDVFSLATTTQGTLLAGTSHGIYRLDGEGWTDSSDLFGAPQLPEATAPEQQEPATKPKPKHIAPAAAPHQSGHKAVPTKPSASRRPAPSHARVRPISYVLQKRAPVRHSPVKAAKKVKAHATAPVHQAPARKVARAPEPPTEPGPPPPPTRLDAAVYSMVADGDAVYAGTTRGLYRSAAEGHAWEQVSSLAMTEVPLLASQQQMLMAADLNHIWLSKDSASTWNKVRLPSGLTEIRAIAVDEAKQLWVGGREGVFYSPDGGASWKTLRNLFVLSVAGLYFDAPEHRVLVSSTTSTITFAVHVPDHKVSYWETGWALRFVRPVGDHLIGATLFDGMVLQPQMVVSDLKPAK